MDIGPNGIRDICTKDLCLGGSRTVTFSIRDIRSKVVRLGGENGQFQHNRTSNM
jgi:hypothetical protein